MNNWLLLLNIEHFPFISHHQHTLTMNLYCDSLLLDEHLAAFNGVYEQPWTRISPYFFGICLGYILHKADDKLKINWVTLTCGWIACLFLFAAILFSKTVIEFSNRWMNATMSVAHHTIWSMILFWIILASITQYRGDTSSISQFSFPYSQFRAFALNIWFIDFVTSGIIGRFVGSKSLLPLSKITNCVLLIYPLVSRVIILSSDGTFHLSVGLIVSIAINSPCSRLQCEGLIRMFCTIFCFFIADDNVFWHVGHCLFDRICAVHDLWGTIWPAIATDLQSTLKLNSQSPLLQQWIVKFNSIIIVPTSWLYICNNIRIIKFYTRILDKKFKLCASLDVRCSSLHNGRKERSKQKKIHRRDFDPRQHKNHIKRS